MRKGYVLDGHWYDKNDQPHFLQNMEDSYLNNVVKLLEGRFEQDKKEYTEENLKVNENFLQDVKSLVAIVCEQERRISVLETNVGQLLYK